jgi:hypothetical protein
MIVAVPTSGERSREPAHKAPGRGQPRAVMQFLRVNVLLLDFLDFETTNLSSSPPTPRNDDGSSIQGQRPRHTLRTYPPPACIRRANPLVTPSAPHRLGSTHVQGDALHAHERLRDLGRKHCPRPRCHLRLWFAPPAAGVRGGTDGVVLVVQNSRIHPSRC